MPESNTQTNNPLDSEPPSIEVDVSLQHSIEVSVDRIENICQTILREHNWLSGEISVAIVDDPTIHELNRQYLNHDYETDVLSFVLDQDVQQRRLMGEIIISADTAKTVAVEVGVSTVDELLLYLIHGMLHLIGLDDKDGEARKEMRAAEEKYTAEFGIQYRAPDEESNDPEIGGPA